MNKIIPLFAATSRKPLNSDDAPHMQYDPCSQSYILSLSGFLMRSS
uniref:Uncharacterized protein n=1 Tax=Klebsiella pneumoniae TaxID=573 RepID=A0A5P1PLZ8_KLEPN|nr:hypothetical protein [Klebsiella pneumoniae]QEQ69883.1 hypothetical protein [Klebsiella pneumoniae]QEQ70280.1 hypothetical protein [Klebsiella pneumoniae]UMW89520.1 hypothetical protein [Klebsiella pneumoniae]